MAKKRVGKNWIRRHPLRSLGLLFFFAGVLYGFRDFRYAQPLQVMEVSTGLTFGDTTLSGELQKDAAMGVPGSYYLATEDGYYILLDTEELDSYIGKSVVINGYLSPAPDEKSLPFMTVTTLVTN